CERLSRALLAASCLPRFCAAAAKGRPQLKANKLHKATQPSTRAEETSTSSAHNHTHAHTPPAVGSLETSACCCLPLPLPPLPPLPLSPIPLSPLAAALRGSAEVSSVSDSGSMSDALPLPSLLLRFLRGCICFLRI